MKSYLITDPSFYTHDLDTFVARLGGAFKRHRPDFALYRDKNFSDYAHFAAHFVKLCKHYGVKSMLHNHAPLALELQAYGVHYSSDKICSIGITDRRLFQVLSTHKKEEIQAAYELSIDAVTFSPIFFSPNKAEPKGIATLIDAVKTSPLPIIALGGIIEKKDINEIKNAQAWAFASIRYFQEN